MNVHRGFRRFELRPFTDSVRRCVRDHCRTARVGAGLRLESIDMSASNDGYRRVRWTFLTNHARALVCIAEDPQVRLHEIAQRIGITERAAQSLVNDLVEAGYVSASVSDGGIATRSMGASLSATSAIASSTSAPS
jgi:hypothetical protein